jgi:hypothetical protein
VTEGPTPEDDDLIPVSVRLGNVVPPEDPEDWTRPLTWVAAIGMLVAPAILFGWILVAAPTDSVRPLAGTYAVAIALAVGAAAAGGTQLGRARAVTGTLASGLLGALLVVLWGAVTAGEVGWIDDMHLGVAMATPNLAHAAAAALAGLAGAVPASVASGLVAGRLSRLQRGALAGLVGGIAAAVVLPRLF